MAFIENRPTGTSRGNPFIRGHRYRVLREAPSYTGYLTVGEIVEYFGSYYGIYDGASVYAFIDDQGRERTWMLYDDEPLEIWTRIFEAIGNPDEL
jgi:hypothetical protein